MDDVLLVRLPTLPLAEIAAMMRLHWKRVKIAFQGSAWERIFEGGELRGLCRQSMAGLSSL